MARPKPSSNKNAIEQDPNEGPGNSKRDHSGKNAAKFKFPGLTLVATPIGNLGDMSARALECLGAVDRVACEDTRVTGKLLHHFGIKKPLVPYHEHNAAGATEKILGLLDSGENIALVSDAGMPLISDPGYRLVQACAEHGHKISGVPGASAPLLALILSGLPSDRFLFAGFLPSKTAARRKVLEGDKHQTATLIYLDSPKRIARTLHETAEIFGSRTAAVGRELTKMYEEIRRGTLSELAQFYEESQSVKGEMVLVIEGASPNAQEWTEAAVDEMLQTLLETATFRDSVDATTDASGWSRSKVYKRALLLGNTGKR